MTDDELLALCEGLRNRTVIADAEHVELAEKLGAELRDLYFRLEAPRVPPTHIMARLRRAGWLSYELTWALVQRIAAGYEANPDNPAFTRSKEADGLLLRATTAARNLPWPAYSPRVLGAIRAEALAASKRDTEQGYREADQLHKEARRKYHDYWHAVGKNPPQLRWALDQVMVQLELAETGTACRTAERLISKWRFESVDAGRGEQFWYDKMFRDLGAGAEVGRSALDRVAVVEQEQGLADRVDENHLALLTSYRNPGVMTARAHLLRFPMTALLERDNKRPIRGAASWGDARDQMLAGALAAYREIEHPASGVPMRIDDQRSLVQLRLNLAWLQPGICVESVEPFAPCLARPVLDAQAVEELSAWLAEVGEDGRKHGDANVIGSAVMPFYLSALRATLGDAAWERYAEWRRRWFVLDRHEDIPGRRDFVENVLLNVT